MQLVSRTPPAEHDTPAKAAPVPLYPPYDRSVVCKERNS